MIYEEFKKTLIDGIGSDKALLVGSHVFDVMVKSLHELLFVKGDKDEQKETYKLCYENFMHYLEHSDLVKDHLKSIDQMALMNKKEKTSKDLFLEFIESIKNLKS